MGIGLVLAVDPTNVKQVQEKLKEAGEASYQIGHLRQRPENAEKIEIK